MAKETRVGALVLVGLVIAGAAIFILGRQEHLWERKVEYELRFARTNGLQTGAPVSLSGVPIGSVDSLRFAAGPTTNDVEVRVRVDADVATRIRTDSRGEIRTLGLLGDKVIDISIGTPRYGVLRAGDTISVSPSLDYEAVLTQAAGAVADMVELTHDMRKLTGGLVAGEGTIGQLITNRRLYDEFVGTIRRANVMLGTFENPNGTLAKMLNDPTLYNRFVSVVTSADSLVLALNDKNGTIGKLLRDDTLYTHIVRMAQAGDSLMRMISSGNGLAARLLNDPTLYDRLNKLTTDLGAILEDVRKDPRRYTRGIICVWNCK